MGTYSTTLFCQTNDAKRVATVLLNLGRSAFVLPPKHGYVLVYDQECDDQDQVAIGQLCSHLSRELETTILAVVNGDDDLLVYYLYVDGSLRDHYRSSSAPSDKWGISPSDFGSVPVLCEVFNRPRSSKKLENILTSSAYLFESERFEALSTILGLPYKYAQFSYREISESINNSDMKSSSVMILTRSQLKGMGGFELPLRIYDPEREVQALVRENRLISAIDLYRRENMCTLEEAYTYVMSLTR